MRRKTAVLLCAAVMLGLPGCAEAPAHSAAEEIVRHCWSLGQTGSVRACRLSFDGDEIHFCAEGYGEPVELCGECFVSGSSITVLSETCGTVCFDYQLCGDKLILRCCGREVTLLKSDGQNDLVQN